MKDLLIRDVPDDVVARLKERARRHGRSLQQELLQIVTDSAYSSLEDYVAEVREQRARYRARRGPFADSAELLREDRDR